MKLSLVAICCVFAVAYCSSCSFETDKGYYDLSSLNDNELRWEKPFTDTVWYYRPCSPTKMKCGAYKNAALCEKDDNGNFHSGGTFDSRKESSLDSDKDGLEISYRHGDVGCGGIARSSTVRCICDASQEGVLEDVEEIADCTYLFNVVSKACCAVPKPVGSGKTIFIVIIVVLIIYFLGGFLFMTFVKKESGVNAIPNAAFWGAVGAGISKMFTFIASKTFRRSQYTQV
ncbi:hypothetical protein P9112_004553 [Eukaryota sp. TZLM1-RC]